MELEKIPEKLRNVDFRFYLIAPNDKNPIEKRWNKNGGNNYPFCDSRLLNHKGNLGIVTGIGGLIVLDFDDWEFYKSIRDRLPFTFTVKTAKKRQYHKYFFLDGEMIGKIPIDNEKGIRICDIQGAGAGVVCPASTIEGRYYEVQSNDNIATISLDYLKELFPRISVTTYKEFDSSKVIPCPEKVQIIVDTFAKLGIKRTRQFHYKCPFHEMQSSGNLFIYPDGKIHCFHERKQWSLETFIKLYEQVRVKT